MHNRVLGPLKGTTKRKIFLGEGERLVAVQGGDNQVLSKENDRAWSIDGDEGVAKFGGGASRVKSKSKTLTNHTS
ncbi:hypothetical protein V2J09_022262 [Rumex salicifolius]